MYKNKEFMIKTKSLPLYPVLPIKIIYGEKSIFIWL